MKNFSVLFCFLILFSTNTYAQCPVGLESDAGSVTLIDDGGVGIPFVVCFGETVSIVNNGDAVLPPGPSPGLIFGYYSCQPTEENPEMDPCYLGSAWTGDTFINTNNGGTVSFLGMNTFWVAPMTADNVLGSGYDLDSDGDMCFDASPGSAFEFTFLDEIIINEVDLDECLGTVTLEIEGGYPPLFGGVYGINYIGGGVHAQSGANGEIITITGLLDGDSYALDITDDGAGCTASFSGGPISQVTLTPSVSYDPICFDGSGFPASFDPPGGTFEFDPPPGDGAFIDGSTGEIIGAIMDYDVIYTVSNACADFSVTTTVTVLPQPAAPTVPPVNEFCESASAQICPVGIGDFYSLYANAGDVVPLWTGACFDMASFVAAGAGSVEFYATQTISGCESDGVFFMVEIFAESPPLGPFFYAICEGESVTISPQTGVGTGSSDFSFYGDPGLTDFLHSGDEYTFTPPGGLTIYVTEDNHGCTTASIPIEIEVVEAPGGFVDEPTYECDEFNESYSVLIVTGFSAPEAENVIIISGTGSVIDNGGGSFIISGVPSGSAVLLNLIGPGPTFCESELFVDVFECGCTPPEPPANPIDQTICTGDVIPDLSISVPGGVEVNWYDAEVGGSLLLGNSTTYTPLVAGTYYAEAVATVDDCINPDRTAVVLTVNTMPVFVSEATTCAADLLSYSVNLQITDAASIQVSTGTISGAAGNFTVTGIPIGTTLTYSALNAGMTCTLGPLTVTSPACPCPAVAPLVTGADQMICDGDAMPTLSVTVGANQTADWYDAAMDGNSLASNSLTYTPGATGTYYVEARNTINNCVSVRDSIIITSNPLPTFTLTNTMCAADLTSYTVNIMITNADVVAPALGVLVDNGGGSFTITNITNETPFNFTLTNSTTTCSDMFVIAAPDCSCAPVTAPVSLGDELICIGDDIPTLEVTVGALQTVDWYDAAIGGNELLANSTTFTPVAAGTYYAGARIIADGCISNVRTAVMLTIEAMPILVSTTPTCALDLQTYSVDLQITNAATLTIEGIGAITNNGGGSFTVASVPASENLVYTAFNTSGNCSLGPNTVTALECPCPLVNQPIITDTMICAGDPVPTLEAMVGSNETVDWFDAASDGTLLLGNNLIFTPPSEGTYYLETKNTINNCLSERDSVIITRSLLSSFIINSTTCAADLLSYNVSITVSNTEAVLINVGTLVPDVGDPNHFDIINIPADVELNLILLNLFEGCDVMEVIPAPDCSCAPVTAPVSQGDTLICIGDDIPTLEMTVDAGQTIDWYDVVTGGTPILTNSTTFTPVVAGTYYAEARIIADGCISNVRTAVMLTIEPTPVLVSTMPTCAADLQSYSVDLQINDAASLTIEGIGTITNNGGGSFTIIDIPIGENLVYTAFNASGECFLGPNTVTGLECPCPFVMAPVVSDTTICEGDPIPTLEVVAGMDETIDWYDAASDGTLLLGNSLTFTPATPGTYYLETRNTINGCLSERDSITITRTLLPTLTINSSICAVDLLTYNVSITIANVDAADVLVDAGTLVVDPDDANQINIIDIPAGVSVNLVLGGSIVECDEVLVPIPAQDCNCDLINAPVSQGDLSICSGEDIPALVANVEAGQVVNWYDASVGGNLLQANSTSFTPIMAGVYFAEAQVAADGCISIRTAVSFEINTQPALVSEEAACVPDLLSYTVELQITDGLTLNNDVGILVDNTGGSFTITDIPAGTNLTYTAFNIDSTCTLGPIIVTAPDCSCPVIVMPTPDVVSQSICDGDAIPDLIVTVGADQTANWYDAPEDGVLQLGNSLTFTPTGTITLYVEAKNTINNCVSERVAISLIINPIPSFIITESTCSDDLLTYELVVTATNANLLTANLGNVVDNGDGTFTVSNITEGEDVEISLLNTESNCNFVETVTAPDCSCPIIAAPLGLDDVAICVGETIPAFDALVDNDQTVNWYDAATGGNQILASTTTFTPTDSGTFYAEAYDAVTGCASLTRTAVSLMINENPTLAVTDFSLPTCNEEDGSIELEAIGGLAPYSYQLNAATFQSDPFYINLAASNYNIQVEDANGCSNSLMQNLVSPEDVFASAGNEMELTCDVLTVTLDGSTSETGANIVYQWLAPNGDLIPDATTNQLVVEVGGTYTLMVSNTESECTREAQVLVTENNASLEVDAGEQQNLTCDSEEVSLVGMVVGSGSFVFEWTTSQGGSIVGQQNGLSAIAEETGLYYLNILNTDNGCTGVDSVIVVELLPENLDVTIEANSPACFGDGNGNIAVQSNDPSVPLLFSLNDSPFTASTVYTDLAPGNYTLQIQDAQGCLSDSLILIEQGADIVLELGDDRFISLGDSTLLGPGTILSMDAFSVIQWSGSNLLSCDTCLATYTHNLKETTLFTLQLIDDLGCTATDDIRVFVDRKRHIFVPSAFSPNGDGFNDELTVFGGKDVLNIKSFRIFDRWGELVFEKIDFSPSDPSAAWTGIAPNNEPFNSNVYIYVLEVEFIDGEIETFAGDITLLR